MFQNILEKEIYIFSRRRLLYDVYCGVCDNQCVIINGRFMTNTFVHWHTQIICIFIHLLNVVALSRAYRSISRAETQKLQQQQQQRKQR